MTAVSLGTVWEETIAFMRREIGLLLPVAFATFGVAQLIIDLGMGGQTVDTASKGASAGSLALLPAMLILFVGNLAISHMVLRPGGSVGESMSAALHVLPRALLAILALFLIMMGIALVVVIAATLGAMAFQADPKAITPHIATLLMIPMFVIMARFMPLIPILAIERLGAIESVRRAWAMSRPHFVRLFGLMMIVVLVTIIMGMIQFFVIGSLFKLLTLASGNGELTAILQAVVDAGIASVLSLAVTIYIALIYRQLAAASGDGSAE